MKEQKTTRYLKYAVGEIALVVVGILIALQVNNWNENRKLKNAEIRLLKEMRAALLKDQDDIISNIAEHEFAAHSCSIILDAIEEDRPYHDSLRVYFASALNTTRFVHTSGPYETLKIKGPDLVENDSLRLKLSEYYDTHVDYQFDLQRSSLESFNNALEKQFELFKNFFSVPGQGIEPVDFEQLKRNNYYQSWLQYTRVE